MGMLIIFVMLIAAAIANLTAPAGAGIMGTREATWLLTLGLLAGLLIVAGRTICARWDGVLIDRNNRISLSRLQLVLWVAVIVSALLTGALTNMRLGNPTPLNIIVPPEIWALLGLGSFTAVAAPAIKEAQKNVAFRSPAPFAQGTNAALIEQQIKSDQALAAAPVFVNRVLVKESPKDARWVDLINGDYEGAAVVDVSKLQQLVFTAALVITYGASIWQLMAKAPFTSFPPVYPALVALLGISQATYLTDKQINNS